MHIEVIQHFNAFIQTVVFLYCLYFTFLRDAQNFLSKAIIDRVLLVMVSVSCAKENHALIGMQKKLDSGESSRPSYARNVQSHIRNLTNDTYSDPENICVFHL